MVAERYRLSFGDGSGFVMGQTWPDWVNVALNSFDYQQGVRSPLVYSWRQAWSPKRKNSMNPPKVTASGRYWQRCCAWIALSVAAAVAILRYADGERARDLRQWQTRLAIVADSRAAAVDNWLADQAGILQGLAENASVQLYLMEASRQAAIAEETPERDYLRNLLTVVAAERGYVTKPLGPDVAANVNRTGLAGIALISADGRPVAASPGMPPFDGVISSAWSERTAGQARLIDLHFGADGAARRSALSHRYSRFRQTAIPALKSALWLP